MYLKALMFWLAMLVVAVAFGALRELAVTPVLGDMAARALCSVLLSAARALCSVLLSAALFGLVLLFVRLARPSGHGALLSLGVFWAGLTLAFEFGMGWSRGLALEAMLADYDLLKGRLWTLVPLTLLFGPMAAASITRPRR